MLQTSKMIGSAILGCRVYSIIIENKLMKSLEK